ncbi:6,7-dimethyl-8-ribityllumazine synthase, partial [bacterium]|nr:6,7-dimethyl-8-ribityllumazine synthase [bacterium]
NIKKFDAFLALGCVIKGQTPHFDLICNSTFNAILKLSIDFNKPIGNGIITALNMKQAVNRSQKNSFKIPNKGSEAAKAVLSILNNEPKKI